MQEEQIVQTTRKRQEGPEELANGKNVGRPDAELRHGAGQGEEAADDRIRTIPAESAQPNGHAQSGKSILYQVHQE